ncbi:MAG: hypothetical protein IKH04_02710 [Kiritimatiellae bacterium]|nr:hypothetical protein [Kiritimatiellia bacterium]
MAEMTPITPDMQPVAEGDGTPYVSERFRLDNVDDEPAKEANYTLAGICSIVALVLFAVALAIVVMDWNFLSNA